MSNNNRIKLTNIIAKLPEEVIQYTVSGSPIDYTAQKAGLTHDCVFSMRHKILIAIRDLLAEEKTCLSGVSELNETFALDSYKGSPLPDSALLPARKHGASARKRGLSNEYVCICTGCSIKDISMGENGMFYNLNTVNNFHLFIKNQYVFYRSVATKYLNRYNALFSFAYKHTEDKVGSYAASFYK